MRNKIEQLKATWTFKNLLLIVCLALVLANVLQTFPITLPTYAVAYEVKEKVSPVDLETLVNERAEVIHETMKKESKYKAMRQIYDELGLMVTAEYESFE